MTNVKYKIIFHIDLNAFYASCAISNDSSLENKAIVIAKNDPLRKSIILTASYEARKLGIKTAMQLREAILLCPNVIIVEPDFALYEYYSNLFFEYLRKVSPKLEIASIDEGYLDVSDICLGTEAISLAQKIQKDLVDLYKMPCSIGIAPNKFLAKMASNMKKPLGITILRKREVDTILWPLPIGAMIGVGRKTKPKLESLGIKTIGDAANFKDKELLRKTVGNSFSKYLAERSHGIDNSEVNYSLDDEVLSISKAHTFYTNTNDIFYIKNTLKLLTNTVSDRLIRKQLYASNIGIQLKFSNFHSINRSRGLSLGINDSFDLWEIIEDLFEEFYDGYSEIRLVGVFATRFTDNKEENKQISIFDDFDQLHKEENIIRLLDDIKDRYGQTAINVGYYEYNKEEE